MREAGGARLDLLSALRVERGEEVRQAGRRSPRRAAPRSGCPSTHSSSSSLPLCAISAGKRCCERKRSRLRASCAAVQASGNVRRLKRALPISISRTRFSGTKRPSQWRRSRTPIRRPSECSERCRKRGIRRFASVMRLPVCLNFARLRLAARCACARWDRGSPPPARGPCAPRDRSPGGVSPCTSAATASKKSWTVPRDHSFSCRIQRAIRATSAASPALSSAAPSVACGKSIV